MDFALGASLLILLFTVKESGAPCTSQQSLLPSTTNLSECKDGFLQTGLSPTFDPSLLERFNEKGDLLEALGIFLPANNV